MATQPKRKKDIPKETGMISRAEGSRRDEFLSVAVHQLRTPLSVIKFVAENLMKIDGGNLTGGQQQKLLTIHQSVESAINLVNDMLNISRLAAKEVRPVFEECDLRQTIANLIETIKPAALAKNQRIIFHMPIDVHLIKVCNEYLHRALQNIIDNAVGYGDESSEIVVSLTEDDTHTEYMVSVHNFGPLIPKEELPKMFEKFHRIAGSEKIKPTGTGLGLFIAKEAIELNGGKIWIESAPKKGTTVYFTVPFRAPSAK